MKTGSEQRDFPPEFLYHDDGHTPIRLDVELFELSDTSVAADIR